MNTPLKNCPMCNGTGKAGTETCVCIKLNNPDNERMAIMKQEASSHYPEGRIRRKTMDIIPAIKKHYDSLDESQKQ